MGKRFDEIELEPEPLVEPVVEESSPAPTGEAGRWRRLLALLTDLSLFAALVLALSPLLPASGDRMSIAALAGFVVVVSYYYFVGSWLLWGKTVGGAIFDVRVVANEQAMSLRDATMRWVGVYVSLLTAGIGFAMAVLPSRRSLPDRLSDTRCVSV